MRPRAGPRRGDHVGSSGAWGRGSLHEPRLLPQLFHALPSQVSRSARLGDTGRRTCAVPAAQGNRSQLGQNLAPALSQDRRLLRGRRRRAHRVRPCRRGRLPPRRHALSRQPAAVDARPPLDDRGHRRRACRRAAHARGADKGDCRAHQPAQAGHRRSAGRLCGKPQADDPLRASPASGRPRWACSVPRSGCTPSSAITTGGTTARRNGRARGR